ncbi:MAG: hypothetical protein L3K10_04050 [Thermoplasmata archaeon]|nr:hypothetical protein [Thermoplasmata archaeon]
MPEREHAPTERTGPTDDPWAVAERRSRAIEEPLDVRCLRNEPFPLLEVRNPLHRTSYRVMLPTFPDRSVALCTCTDFARRGLGTCKHIEAGGRWLERHPQVPPSAPAPPFDPAPVWEEIDQRLERPVPPGVPDSLRWREAGAVLYERAGPAYLPDPEKKEEVGRGGGKGRSRSTPSRARP